MKGRHMYKVRQPGRLVLGILLILSVIILLVVAFFAVRSLFNKNPQPTPTISATLMAVVTPTPTIKPTATPTPSSQVIRVKLSSSAATVRIRKQPSTTADILGEVKHNVTLPYLGESGTWWMVSYQSQTGYLLKDYGVLEAVKTPTPSPTKTPSPSPSKTP